jgi:bifunctional UDP-N-acetylglucosamine pyrophosphorylase/glucosamine-1-phosphate N-acetyltransferase
MKSKTPKVLHKMAGKPILHHTLDACIDAGIEDIVVVVGHQGEAVQAATPHKVHFVWQEERLGTGHAVMCAKEHIELDEQVLVLFGDSPLLTPALLQDVIAFQKREEAHAVVVSTQVPDPFGYGRVFAGEDGVFIDLVEQRDLTGSQGECDIINTSMFMAEGRALLYGLERIGNANSQNEYYLTDVPKELKHDGYKVAVFHSSDYTQFLGINTQIQLAEARAVMHKRIAETHMNNGVVLIDPVSTYIDSTVTIEPDVTVYPGTILEGMCHIAEDAVIGPNCRIVDSHIGAGSTVQNSVIEGAKVGKCCTIGPFAYLRKDTVVGDHCRVGDFVELKNTTLGNGSKASHLAYIGDAEVGEGVNFGCGTITVNYDGKNKFKTVIEDGAFVGSNVNLIAPVTVHSGAYVAAGSTITDEVPADALAIARPRQTIKEGWAKDKKK